MRTQPTKEELQILPPAPTGKKWERASTNCIPPHGGLGSLISAYFKLTPTHREDGTPLNIPPLPEIEGYRVEYFGKGMTKDDMGDADSWVSCAMHIPWKTAANKYKPSGNERVYYARLFKIAKPTTLQDLVGEDGQKNFYIIQGDDSMFQGEVDTILGTLEVNSGELIYHINRGRRWSHSPFTSYEEANEFVV